MNQKQASLEKEITPKCPVLYVAFELGNSTWKMACSDGRKVRQVTVTARDLEQLQRALLRTQAHFGMGEAVAVVSCYEAGRDGFWLHRYLQSRGIDNVVVDSASLEVDRRRRRAKTDRIDAGKLLRMLIRYHGGDRQLWR
jgi:transposase